MVRFVFDNLIYKCGENRYILLNLFNFRREIINGATLTQLLQISQKQSNGTSLLDSELSLLQIYYEKRQFLPGDTIHELDKSNQLQSQISLKKYPIKSITLNVSYHCNFKCSYCYQRNYKYHSAFSKTMEHKNVDEIYHYLMLECFDTSNFNEIVISGGEPLLLNNISVINYIINRFPKQKKILFTNGINIMQFKEKIPFAEIDEYQISLDGPDSVIADVNKSTKAYEDIIQGILYLISLGKTITIATLLTKDLGPFLLQFVSDLKSHNIIDSPNVSLKFNLEKNYYSAGKFDDSVFDWEYIRNIRKKLNPQLMGYGTTIPLHSEVMDLSLLLHRPKNQRYKLQYQKCDLSTNLPAVFGPDGKVYWCLCLGSENGVIGNYQLNEVFHEKIHKLGNRTVTKIEACKSCSLRYVCRGGCVLPLTSGPHDYYRPNCGMFSSDYFWEHLEDLI